MIKSRQSGLPSHAFYPVALKMSCSTVLLSYRQATWLWYFRHCAVSGPPSRAFYPVALKISSSAFSRFLSIT
jgi:hypothetical protein